MTTRTTASATDRAARHSDTLAWAVRAGLVGYAVLHLLVAWIALRLVLTSAGGTVTGRGALAQVAEETSGRILLVAMAVGFAALVVWQLVAAAVGYRDRDGWSRLLMRLGAACRAVLWGYLAVMSTEVAAAGAAARGGSPSSTTATVMAWPAGPWLVAAVGVTVVGTGIGLGIFGWRGGFLDQLEPEARSHQGRRVPIDVVGRVGYVTKGVALVVIGLLLVWAARTHDPQKSGGLDQSLHELVGGALGRAAIIAVAVGLACYSLFLLARARHLNRDAITS